MAVDVRLIALRSVYFFFVAAASGMVRFLVVLLDKLGYNAFQIGVLCALRPGVSFIASFFWGYIGDLTNSRLLILILGGIFSCVALSALLFNKVQNNIYYTGATIIVTTWIGSVTSLLDAIVIVILQESHSHSKDKNKKKSSETKAKNGNKYDETSAEEKESEKETKSGKYGATRLWGAVGWGLGSFVCSLLVSYFGESFIIYFYDFNMACACLVLIFVFPCAIKSAKIKRERKLHLQQESLLWNEYNANEKNNNDNDNNAKKRSKKQKQGNLSIDIANIDENARQTNETSKANDSQIKLCKDENISNSNDSDKNEEDANERSRSSSSVISEARDEFSEQSRHARKLFATPIMSSPVMHFEGNDDIGDFDNYIKSPNEYEKRHQNIKMDSKAASHNNIRKSLIRGKFCKKYNIYSAYSQNLMLLTAKSDFQLL